MVKPLIDHKTSNVVGEFSSMAFFYFSPVAFFGQGVAKATSRKGAGLIYLGGLMKIIKSLIRYGYLIFKEMVRELTPEEKVELEAMESGEVDL